MIGSGWPEVGRKILWVAVDRRSAGEGQAPHAEGSGPGADNFGYVDEADSDRSFAQLQGVSSAIRLTGWSAIRVKMSVK